MGGSEQEKRTGGGGIQFYFQNLEKLNSFNNRVSYEKNEAAIIIKFDANEITLEEVVDYAFHEIKAIDMKVSEIGIEDVVKKIFSEEENRGKDNV